MFKVQSLNSFVINKISNTELSIFIEITKLNIKNK
jgi:hypothetical protein